MRAPRAGASKLRSESWVELLAEESVLYLAVQVSTVSALT